ncbi:NnrS family protein [Stappia sp. F7233]|uniref:NnrS family protein n=1 Tax=Stappia albiluteola TaxID=2758565 RepID=A0A839A9S3_9HYPH|nr:NnrS family protein [Stappia albiluteola]MBA5775687.1 NnrS family protein [Stappia albiluteola]
MSASSSLAARRARSDAGWLFSASFRPFFFGASTLAVVSIPLWVWMYLTGVAEVAGMPAMAWHAHEMVFGFLPAVMAGYLLSATPNWSGKLPASGKPLALLFALWAAGRIVPLLAPLPLAVAADAAFPVVVTLALVREARVKAPRQSRHGLMLFPVLAVASVAHRLLAADYDTASMLARVGVAVAVLLISAVGGRLVPSLTRNALANRGADRVPEPYGRYDVALLAVIFPALAAWAITPAYWLSTALLGLAAILQGIRLFRWRGWLVRQFDVLALHAGYLWVVVGTALAAMTGEPFGFVPPDTALHAFTAGAIGCMTMAVMTRLSTSRGIGTKAGELPCAIALAAVNLSAVARVSAPMLGESYAGLLVAGSALWALAWLLFCAAQLGARFK